MIFLFALAVCHVFYLSYLPRSIRFEKFRGLFCLELLTSSFHLSLSLFLSVFFRLLPSSPSSSKTSISVTARAHLASPASFVSSSSSRSSPSHSTSPNPTRALSFVLPSLSRLALNTQHTPTVHSRPLFQLEATAFSSKSTSCLVALPTVASLSVLTCPLPACTAPAQLLHSSCTSSYCTVRSKKQKVSPPGPDLPLHLHKFSLLKTFRGVDRHE